jgi:hypothetical protein
MPPGRETYITVLKITNTTVLVNIARKAIRKKWRIFRVNRMAKMKNIVDRKNPRIGIRKI